MDTNRVTTPITDKRGKTVHLSMLGFKPLCKPHVRIVFHSTIIGTVGTRLCNTCAQMDLQLRSHGGDA